MGLRPLPKSNGFYSYSAGIDFRRHILTSEVDPRAVRIEFATSAYVVRM